jgi:hypothetical protein
MSDAPIILSESMDKQLFLIEITLPQMIRYQGDEETAIAYLEDLKNRPFFSTQEHWGDLMDATICEVKNGVYS